jgi:uncharacterized OB-fold protein
MVELIFILGVPALLFLVWRRLSVVRSAVYLAPNPYTGPACTACGHATVPGADHCSSCGARLVPAA